MQMWCYCLRRKSREDDHGKTDSRQGEKDVRRTNVRFLSGRERERENQREKQVEQLKKKNGATEEQEEK